VGNFSSSAESKFSDETDIGDVETAEHELVAPATARAARRRAALFGGGTIGNERLTSLMGAILIVLLAALGITILRVRQLIWPHLFLGLLLISPVMLKMTSTGYRFVRYYTRNAAYRLEGPPEPLLRAIAPLLVASTVVVFVSGVLLLAEGPSSRDQLLPLHKISFIVWGVFFALHVLGHLPRMLRALRNARSDDSPGAAGRWIAIAGALVAGLILAIVLIPQFGPWTTHAALFHGGDH
jgi:hypothetical protein